MNALQKGYEMLEGTRVTLMGLEALLLSQPDLQPAVDYYRTKLARLERLVRNYDSTIDSERDICRAAFKSSHIISMYRYAKDPDYFVDVYDQVFDEANKQSESARKIRHIFTQYGVSIPEDIDQRLHAHEELYEGIMRKMLDRTMTEEEYQSISTGFSRLPDIDEEFGWIKKLTDKVRWKEGGYIFPIPEYKSPENIEYLKIISN